MEDIDGYADELCNYLSDKYEYCIEGFNVDYNRPDSNNRLDSNLNGALIEKLLNRA